MTDTYPNELQETDETESLMIEATERIAELEAERDDFRDRWLKAKAECAELRLELDKLKSVK